MKTSKYYISNNTTHKQYKRRYGWLGTKSRLPYYFIALYFGLFLIGIMWYSYNATTASNLVMAEEWGKLQEKYLIANEIRDELLKELR